MHSVAIISRKGGAGTSPGKRPERVGKKGFVVYLDHELLHQVKTVALAERKTLQEIGVEALEELVEARCANTEGRPDLACQKSQPK